MASGTVYEPPTCARCKATINETRDHARIQVELRMIDTSRAPPSGLLSVVRLHHLCMGCFMAGRLA